MIIFAELLEDGDRIECLLEVILVLGRHILQEAHDDLLAFCSQNLLHLLLLSGEDALVLCFVLVVFLVGVFPLIHAGFKTCLFGGLGLDLNLEQLDGQQRQRVVRHVLHQPIKNGTFRLEQQVLAHPLFILAEQEANDLVEVAAEDWQHLFVLGLEEVLDQRIKQTCVPLRLRLLGGWLLIFSIWLLKLEFGLLGLLVLQIQLVNHRLLLLLLVLHYKFLFGFRYTYIRFVETVSDELVDVVGFILALLIVAGLLVFLDDGATIDQRVRDHLRTSQNLCGHVGELVRNFVRVAVFRSHRRILDQLLECCLLAEEIG